MRLPWLRGDEVMYVADDGQLVAARVLEEVGSSVEMKTAGGMILTGRLDRVFRQVGYPEWGLLWMQPPTDFGRDLLWPVHEAG